MVTNNLTAFAHLLLVKLFVKAVLDLVMVTKAVLDFVICKAIVDLVMVYKAIVDLVMVCRVAADLIVMSQPAVYFLLLLTLTFAMSPIPCLQTFVDFQRTRLVSIDVVHLESG